MATKKRTAPKTATDLINDKKNINLGNEEGADLIEKSIDEVGFGRSIVVDADFNIIGGNKITAAAIRKGKTKIRVVQSTGDELIVVQRTDLNIDSAKGRKLAILDNTTHKINYVEDAQVAEAIVEEFNFNASGLGLDIAGQGESGTVKKVQIEPFKKSHLLISFPPQALVELQPLIDKISKMQDIEIEQSSN